MYKLIFGMQPAGEYQDLRMAYNEVYRRVMEEPVTEQLLDTIWVETQDRTTPITFDELISTGFDKGWMKECRLANDILTKRKTND